MASQKSPRDTPGMPSGLRRLEEGKKTTTKTGGMELLGDLLEDPLGTSM
jgi:hypothetical protein